MVHSIEKFPDREIYINGKKHLYFGGTAYLGLQTDKDFQNILINNIQKYGTNYGASRKSNVQFSIYNEIETYLADFVGSEACTTLSSGFLAGQLIAEYYAYGTYKLFYTPNTHCAVIQNNAPVYNYYPDLIEDIKVHLKNNTSQTPVVVLDSIDFFGANYPDFTFLKQLPLEDCIVVIDDSHGIGIIGENGSGVYSYIQNLRPKELVVCCSLGKGFGIQAGAIFGTQTTIKKVTKTPFFGGASPATPANIATIKEAESIYRKKRKILFENSSYFDANLKNRAILQGLKGHPAYTFRNKNLADSLEKNEIIVTNFKYPNENSPNMSRIVLSASHKKEDIQHILQCLNTL